MIRKYGRNPREARSNCPFSALTFSVFPSMASFLPSRPRGPSHGFVSSFLAKQTHFKEEDLELLWQALAGMFDHDRSATRGEMATRGLYVFEHESELGNALEHVKSVADVVTASNDDDGIALVLRERFGLG